MDQSFRIDAALGRLRDALTIYQHRGHLVRQDFAETQHRWSDERGRRFGLQHIEPMLAGIEQAPRDLSHQIRQAETALHAVRASEESCGRCQSTLVEAEAETDAVSDLTGLTHSIAADVQAEAGHIDAISRDVDMQLAALSA